MTPKQSLPEIPLHDFKAQYETIRTDIALAIAGVLERQDFVLGAEMHELEREMAALCGTRDAVACASGSDALLLSLMALDVRAGDAVIVPTFTFFATAGAVARIGARPVFVDIEPRSFNLSIESVAEALKRYKVRAAIPVDLFGQAPDMDALDRTLPPDLPVIEDAAQAILAEYNGRRAGSLGCTGTFSFFPSKNLGAYGDAGIITTDDDAIAERLRRIRVHGMDKDRYFHSEVGINSRLDTLQAAVLLVKIKRIEKWTAQREQAAQRYTQMFTEAGLAKAAAVCPSTDSPIVPPSVDAGAPRRHVFHQYTIRALDRDALKQHLDSARIRTSVFYPLPLHLQRCFAELGGKPGDCPEAERASGEVLSLPIYAELTAEQQERIVQTIADFYRGR